MKYTIRAVLGAVLLASTLHGSRTKKFLSLVACYKNNDLTRGQLITAYDNLNENKQLTAGEALKSSLGKSISQLRQEEQAKGAFINLIYQYQNNKVSENQLIKAYDQFTQADDRALADNALTALLQTTITTLRKQTAKKGKEPSSRIKITRSHQSKPPVQKGPRYRKPSVVQKHLDGLRALKKYAQQNTQSAEKNTNQEHIELNSTSFTTPTKKELSKHNKILAMINNNSLAQKRKNKQSPTEFVSIIPPMSKSTGSQETMIHLDAVPDMKKIDLFKSTTPAAKVTIGRYTGQPTFKIDNRTITAKALPKALPTIDSKVIDRWGQQLADKTSTDKERIQALEPLLKAYTSNKAPKEQLMSLMEKTLNKFSDTSLIPASLDTTD